MEAVQIKMALANAKFHLRIVWIGFCRPVYGVVVAGLIAIAIYGFVSVSEGTGWIAVFKFSVACVLLVEGLWQMYLLGRNKKGRAGKRERK